MAFRIIISDEAKADIEHSYLYYKTKVNKKVADNFFKDFKFSLNIISKNPYFKIWFEDFHGKLMKKYPFLIFYTVDKDAKVIVIAEFFIPHKIRRNSHLKNL